MESRESNRPILWIKFDISSMNCLFIELEKSLITMPSYVCRQQPANLYPTSDTTKVLHFKFQLIRSVNHIIMCLNVGVGSQGQSTIL